MMTHRVSFQAALHGRAYRFSTFSTFSITAGWNICCFITHEAYASREAEVVTAAFNSCEIQIAVENQDDRANRHQAEP
jgi:hypothetical protein